MTMEIKKLTDCTVSEMVMAWNRGFDGYTVNLEMDETMFLNRLVTEELSPNHSIVAFVKGEPIGIIMNGFRVREGQPIAWNGGTAVAPEYRGSGIIHQLMEETMAMYAREKVKIATLEAIKSNETAIKLYQKYGYTVVEELVFLLGVQKDAEPLEYEVCSPEELPFLFDYQERVVWQCQPASIKQGEAHVFKIDEKVVGYSLFRRIWSEDKKLSRVNVYQLKLLTEHPAHILRMLATLGEKDTPLMFVNFIKNDPVIHYLLKQGFTVKAEQVWMEKRM